MIDNPPLVFIIDDDVDLVDQLRIRLEDVGYRVLTGETQDEGEKLLEQDKPDLVIFDLMLENQDSGFILSYKTKRMYPEVPVILITGVAGETGIQFDGETEEEHSWIKADVVLNKSIRFEQLLGEIERLLKDKI